MERNEWFDPRYDLLNSAPGREYQDENSPLYSIEYLLLKHREVEDAKLFSALGQFWLDCEIYGEDGLYNQRPYRTGGKDDNMSPDQLIALVAYLKMVGREDEIEAIWSYLKRHLFTYDNIGRKINFKRLMQPMAIAYLGAMTGSWFWEKVLILICRQACSEFDKENEDWHSESSGVLKSFVCLRSLKIFDEYCEKYYEEGFEVYFPEGHPINRYLEQQRER